MPYVVKKDEKACSSSKPWGVFKKGSSKKFGCHATEAEAKKQQAALYAAEAKIASCAMERETERLRVIPLRATIGELARNLPRPRIVKAENAPQNDYGMSLVKVENVPLFEVGMEFPASTGPVTFIPADIVSASSANEDPVIPRPRVKLGHTDPRFNNSYVYDGTPNFGFVENMHADDSGFVCVGDLIDVPEWLAAILPVAYPSRSVEGWFNYDASALNGKSYSFCVTALALLGVVWPGVMSLADLPSMYGAEQPEFVVIQEEAA